MLPEILTRLRAPTPAFWRSLQRRTAASSAAFVALALALASIAGLPPLVPKVLSYAAAVLGGIAAVCSLAVDDSPASPPAQ